MLTRAEVRKYAQKEIYERELSRRRLFDFTKYTFKAYRNENWHHKLISRFVQSAIEKKIKRAMIFAPPRHMKTETMERGFTFAFGRNPDLKLMLCAYGADKAYKISNHIKANLREPLFKNIFTDFPGIQGVDQIKSWTLGGGYRGEALAAGLGGPVTGAGRRLRRDPEAHVAAFEGLNAAVGVRGFHEDAASGREL